MNIQRLSAHLPESRLACSEIAMRFGLDPRFAELFGPVGFRHKLSEEADWRLAFHDGAVAAARNALDGTSRRRIDAMFLTTSTPDLLIPSSVYDIARAIDLEECGLYQILAGSTGPVQVMSLVRTLFSSGAVRTVLLVSGDINSKLIPRDREQYGDDEIIDILQLGDGLCAVLVEDGSEPGCGLGVEHVDYVCGRNREHGLGRYAFARVDEPIRLERAPMPSEGIEDMICDAGYAMYRRALESTGLGPDAIDYILVPEYNGYCTARFKEMLGDEAGGKTVSCYDDIGFVRGASMLFQLKKALDDLPPGGRILGLAVDQMNWGMGAVMMRTGPAGGDGACP